MSAFERGSHIAVVDEKPAVGLRDSERLDRNNRGQRRSRQFIELIQGIKERAQLPLSDEKATSGRYTGTLPAHAGSPLEAENSGDRRPALCGQRIRLPQTFPY